MQPAALGPYRITRLLGRGGMGAVYAAAHPELPREVALKTLTAFEPELLLRFEREAHLLARVVHPGVVRVHGLERAADGTPFLVTELVEGRSLAEASRPSGLPWPAAIRLGRALADAVEAVHRAGVLHRDLKPENALLRPDGSVVLIDFGIARAVERSSLTQSGTLLGTPGYMAPEQADGRGAVDARTDVYGLGATLFALLTGRPPFEGPGPFAVVHAVLHGEPDWQALRARAVPAALERVLRRALARRPEERFASAAELERALAGAAEAPSGVRQVSPLAAALGLSGAALAVVALAVGLALSARPPGADPPGSASASAADVPSRAAVAEAPPLEATLLPPGAARPLPPLGPERVALFRALATLSPSKLTARDRERRATLLRELGATPLDRRPHGEPAAADPCAVEFAGSTTLVWYGELVGARVRGLDVTLLEETSLSEDAAPVKGLITRPLQDGFELFLTRRRRLWRVQVTALRGSLQVAPAEEVNHLPKELAPRAGPHFFAWIEGGAALLVGGRFGVGVQPLDDRQARLLGPPFSAPLTALAARGSSALVATEKGRLFEVDLAGRREPRWTSEAAITRLTPLPDGGFVSGDRAGHIWRWDAADERTELTSADLEAPAEAGEPRRRAHPGEVTGLALDPTRRWLFSTSRAPDGVRVWDLSRGQLVARLGAARPGHRLAVSPDGLLVAVGGREGGFEIWGSPLVDQAY